MGSVPLARVIRSGLEESVHRGDVAVADVSGSVVFAAGDPDRPVFARSSMKPLQAAVSLSLMEIDPPEAEVSVMCASHNAEPIHVATVRSLLARCGVPESALRCPEYRPWDEETAIQFPHRARINSDCSGKHAGMLGACEAQGWPLETYRDPEHPLQRTVLDRVTEVGGQEPATVGVDGCGVPVHGLPLATMAALYARLGAPARFDAFGTFVERAVGAMRAEPYLVAGRNRVDTALMEVTPNLLVKSGAEALICASILDRGLGVAVKVRDGTSRAAGPAMIHALAALGVVDPERLDPLHPFARPAVLGGGVPVGEIVAGFELLPV
ncbi:MAG TPA: asparaginase [Actinomycetota bacterium]|nr:asparaginase [Actinomycetota bacterium]